MACLSISLTFVNHKAIAIHATSTGSSPGWVLICKSYFTINALIGVIKFFFVISDLMPSFKPSLEGIPGRSSSFIAALIIECIHSSFATLHFHWQQHLDLLAFRRCCRDFKHHLFLWYRCWHCCGCLIATIVIHSTWCVSFCVAPHPHL